MINSLNINSMLKGLEGKLGEDDYSEPLEILINSANKNNKFNLFGSIAFKNQLKDRLKMRAKLYAFVKDRVWPPHQKPEF